MIGTLPEQKRVRRRGDLPVFAVGRRIKPRPRRGTGRNGVLPALSLVGLGWVKALCFGTKDES